MKYVSTRGQSPALPFLGTVLEGLAPDGGLYLPERYPQLDFERLDGKDYIGIATEVFGLLAPDVPTVIMRALLRKSYTQAAFGSTAITPLQKLDRDLYLLKLSEGPTLAFKDVPMQFLGNLMEYALSQQNRTLNVLGATSGDTGSAAAYALRGRKGITLFMLSPYGRMSRFQQRQMYTLDERNIHNLVVRGTFDDCQAVVKAVNADARFKQEFRLGAVNSINWARIAAQVVYYINAAQRIPEHDPQSDMVTFAVPSGNFGNALAAHIASEMGVALSLRVCTNENDVLHEFFTTGIYRVRPGSEVKATSSPSMDIASASNFERWVYDFRGQSPEAVRMLWQALAKKGQFNVHDRDPGSFFSIESGMATEAEVLATIATVHKRYGIIIDPHTAVAMKVALENVQKGVPMVVAETAQPAKFADTIRQAIGIEPPTPAAYAKMADLPERTTLIDPDPELVKQYIRDSV